MAALPLFPLSTVLFPGASLPLQIFEPRYLLLVRRCTEEHLPFGVVLIREGSEVGGGAVPFEVGTTARIARIRRAANERLLVVAVGEQRFRILDTNDRGPYLAGDVEMLTDEDEDAPDIEQRAVSVAELFRELMRLKLAIRGEWDRAGTLPERPGALADHVAARLDLDQRVGQRLLEELSVPRRLAIVRRILQGQVERLGERYAGVRRGRFESPAARN